MLDIYTWDEFTEQYVAHSKDGDLTYPKRTMFNPKETSKVVEKVYLRNDDPTKYYSEVSMYYGPAEAIANVLNITYKLLQQDNEPTEAEWSALSSGNIVSLSDIGTASEASLLFIPVWTRVEVPRSTPSGIISDASIYVDYEENEVS